MSDKITQAHVITCLSVHCLFLFCHLPLPLAPLLSLSLSTCSLSCSPASMSSEPPRIKTSALTHNEECWAIHSPLTYTLHFYQSLLLCDAMNSFSHSVSSVPSFPWCSFFHALAFCLFFVTCALMWCYHFVLFACSF